MTTDWANDPANPANENRYPFQRKITAVDTVKDRIDYLTFIGGKALDDTSDYIKELQALLKSLEVQDPDPIDVPDPNIPGLDFGDRPELGGLNLPTDWPVNENSLVLDPVSPLDSVDFPPFNIPDPIFEDVTKPDLQPVGDVPDEPTLSEITIPDHPELDLPSPPDLTDIIIPSPPDITIPPFDADLIPWDVDDPGEFTWGEPVYNSDIWADLLAKVLDGIRNGGTGLNVQVEEDIYWQHLNRTFEENDKLIQQASNYWSARGFTLPPGMLSAKINEINSQISRNNLQASKDITISQAELAQKNTHFIMDKGAQLEGMLREFFIQQANLSLQGQRAVAEHSIAIYNAQVQRMNYYLEEYKTKASIWEARVRAALVEVEIFKARVESAKVSAEVQKLLVDVYSARLAGVKLLVDVYIAQMQGADIEARVQQSIIQAYSERIRGFLARVELNRALIGQYAAELDGEKTKADMYSSRVSAYATHVNAKAQELQGNIAKMGGELEYNKGLIAEYTANISAYNAEVSATAQEIGAKVSGFQALASAYQAETSKEAAHIQAQATGIQAIIQKAEMQLRRGIAMVEAATRGYEAVKQLQVTGTSGIMNVGAQLAASAMNAINTSAGISYSGSDGLTNSFSSSDSLSEIHSYVYNQD